MESSKNMEILRAIIMQHYDQPTNKVDDLNLLKDYIHYHNKSSSCIDDIDFYIKVENDIVVDAKFYGVGCAISTASTDIICDIIKNKNVNFIDKLLMNYYNMINNSGEYDEEILDELIAFCNIHEQSNRKKCASIGADALVKIVEGKYEK